MGIEVIRIVSRKKVYNVNPMYDWLRKSQNYEEEYTLSIDRSRFGELYVPTKIIYDKKLTYSEKLAIVWNYSLKNRIGNQPSITKLAKESGISERTIRKAREKYPKLFTTQTEPKKN